MGEVYDGHGKKLPDDVARKALEHCLIYSKNTGNNLMGMFPWRTIELANGEPARMWSDLHHGKKGAIDKFRERYPLVIDNFSIV